VPKLDLAQARRMQIWEPKEEQANSTDNFKKLANALSEIQDKDNGSAELLRKLFTQLMSMENRSAMGLQN